MSVTATDTLTRIGIGGGLTSGGSVGVGVSAAINVVSRMTSAYIGAVYDPRAASNTPGNGGTSVLSRGDVSLAAKTTGNLWVFAIAGSFVKDDEKDPAANANGQAPDPDPATDTDDTYGPGLDFIKYLFEDPPAGPGNPAPALPGKPKTGLGVAGSLSFNYVGKQDTLAYINDLGTITAHNLAVSADDDSGIISVSGSAAFAFAKGQDSSKGIAGALSFNSIDSATVAVVAGAHIKATAYSPGDPRGPPVGGGGDVTLTATRGGNLWAFSAGLAVTTGRDSTSLAGSVSVTRLIALTEAILSGATVDSDGLLGAVKVTATG